MNCRYLIKQQSVQRLWNFQAWSIQNQLVFWPASKVVVVVVKKITTFEFLFTPKFFFEKPLMVRWASEASAIYCRKVKTSGHNYLLFHLELIKVTVFQIFCKKQDCVIFFMFFHVQRAIMYLVLVTPDLNSNIHLTALKTQL